MIAFENMNIIEFRETVLKINTSITDCEPLVSGKMTGQICFSPKKESVFIPIEHTVMEYFNNEKIDAAKMCHIIEIEKMLIKNQILTERSNINSIQFIVFVILHEEGHREHFKKDYLAEGLNSEDMYLDYNCEMYRLMKYAEDITERARLYRLNSFEKIADEYAIDNIKNNNIYEEFFILYGQV